MKVADLFDGMPCEFCDQQTVVIHWGVPCCAEHWPATEFTWERQPLAWFKPIQPVRLGDRDDPGRYLAEGLRLVEKGQLSHAACWEAFKEKYPDIYKQMLHPTGKYYEQMRGPRK